jgi:hypothetical protein
MVQLPGTVYNTQVLVLIVTVAYTLETKQALRVVVVAPKMLLVLVTKLDVIARVVAQLQLVTVLANAVKVITLLPSVTMQVEIISVMWLLPLDVVLVLAVRQLVRLLLVT